MHRTGRRHERSTQLRHRHQIFSKRHLAIGDIHLLTPNWIRPALLVNRNSLAQPSWYAIARQLEGDHMAELMPENCLPVRRVARLRGWAVGRNHAAKADTQISRVSRHSKRPHGEIRRV